MSRIDSKKLQSEGSLSRTTDTGIGLELDLVITSGSITGVNITSAGKNYTVGTAIIIDCVNGSGADLEVGTIGASGEVTSVTINNGGQGYVSKGHIYHPSVIMAYLVELDWYNTDRGVSEPMYLTNAYNNIKWYDDGTYTTHKEFLALGNIGSISAVEEGFELQSYGIELSLSGIPLEMRRDAFVDATDFSTSFQNRKCVVYATFLDKNYNILDQPFILFSGQMDDCTLSISDDVTLTVNVQSRLINWEVPRGGRYNGNDQKVWYPNDTGFDLIPDIIDKELDWGGEVSTHTSMGGGFNDGPGGGNGRYRNLH